MSNSREQSFHPPPVFVAGALRSGTTMFTIMLNSHPAICCPGEFDFLFDALGPDGGLAAAEQLDPADFEAFLETNRIYEAFLETNRIHQDREFPKFSGSVLDRVHAMVELVGRSKPLLALTIHRNFLSAHELFPGAKFIHLLRDPRDCARSSIGMGWAGNPYYGVDIWLDAERSWDRVDPRLSSDQAIEVRYEMLVHNPVAELTRICEFLGVNFSEDMLDFAGTTYRKPDPAYSEQWKTKLTFDQVRLVEARVGDRLRKRGYEPRTPHPLEPGKLERLYLALQNRLARYSFEIRRIGLTLWVVDKVSRRIGPRSVHVRSQRRINELQRPYLK